MKAAIEYCIDNDILKDFLKRYGSEVVNMLFTEISTEKYGEIRYNEGREDEREKRDKEIAKNALAKGLTLEFVHEITGLPIDEIKKL